MNRRLFLRGLGGAAVAAPFLGSVAERAAKASGSPAAGPPRRLITMFSHYGCLTNRWFPTKSHGELAAADYEPTTLKHLAPFAPKLLMPRGIRTMNEWSFAGTHGQTTDPHTQVAGSYFTCHPVTPNDGKFTAMPTGRSLDHVCGELVNPGGGGPLVMAIGGGRASAQSATSYSAPEVIDPGVGTPTAIFNNLTNLFGDGPMTPDTYQVARGKSVVDIVRDDLRTLQRVDMSAADQQKLADWVDLLDQTGGTVSAQCTAGTAEGLGLTSQGVQGGGGNLGASTNIMLDLAVMSAICDANRVIFMKFPAGVTFNFDGLNHTKDAHGISHRIGDANMGGACLDGVLEMIAEIDDWYAKKFAYLVGRLDSFDEGNGTLLDNTATVWFNELSDGNSHNCNNSPILQAGSCGGYFKTGQAINVEDGRADLTPGHSEEDCVNGETPFNALDGVGTPADIATMPINKYYCNLMNAIGVRAGADGYAAQGGTQDVTHFGRFDDTRDFTAESLNSTAPNINNPGEYMELRA